MEKSNELANIISISYLIICFLIPAIYLIKFHKVKRKKKKYGKAFIFAILLFCLLFSFKLILKLDIKDFETLNCYINNDCKEKEEKQEEQEENKFESNSTKKVTSTTKTTEKTMIVESTTTKKGTNMKTYDKVKEISGTRKDIDKSNKGYTIYQIDGITYVDGYLIANKSYFLREDFVPTDTYKKASKDSTVQCADCINNTAYKAWKDMKADASAIGLNIWIQSGYRSYILQNNLYNRYVSRDGKEKADTYSARPGSSEHQTGLCFDLNSITDAFANTSEGKWVDQNAYKYGFIIRYPKGKDKETGYKYEPWHLRYVGTELATILYNNGNWITMEEYFGITSQYSE